MIQKPHAQWQNKEDSHSMVNCEVGRTGYGEAEQGKTRVMTEAGGVVPVVDDLQQQLSPLERVTFWTCTSWLRSEKTHS